MRLTEHPGPLMTQPLNRLQPWEIAASVEAVRSSTKTDPKATSKRPQTKIIQVRQFCGAPQSPCRHHAVVNTRPLHLTQPFRAASSLLVVFLGLCFTLTSLIRLSSGEDKSKTEEVKTDSAVGAAPVLVTEEVKQDAAAAVAAPAAITPSAPKVDDVPAASNPALHTAPTPVVTDGPSTTSTAVKSEPESVAPATEAKTETAAVEDKAEETKTVPTKEGEILPNGANAAAPAEPVKQTTQESPATPAKAEASGSTTTPSTSSQKGTEQKKKNRLSAFIGKLKSKTAVPSSLSLRRVFLMRRHPVPKHGPAVVLENRGALESTLSPQENKKHTPRGRGLVPEKNPVSMKTAVLFSISALSAYVVAAQAPLDAQCGGSGWTGETSCEAGSSCVAVDEWYSHCVRAVAVRQEEEQEQEEGGDAEEKKDKKKEEDAGQDSEQDSGRGSGDEETGGDAGNDGGDDASGEEAGGDTGNDNDSGNDTGNDSGNDTGDDSGNDDTPASTLQTVVTSAAPAASSNPDSGNNSGSGSDSGSADDTATPTDADSPSASASLSPGTPNLSGAPPSATS
ncbi:hypothetical protein BN1723_003206 [Verticillium longisporum]|uniref:CBM1 domain-containing protein n=1 Tax=Verticillium longisporum TaxID=100787 RepID=A0A0G4LRE5_VERLO|nr:hypothetical protein BN1723_003206 [Verticillium longisporum]